MPPSIPTLVPPAGFKLVPLKPRKKGVGFSLSDATAAIIDGWVEAMLAARPAKPPTRPAKPPTRSEALARAADTLAAVGWRPGDRIRKLPALKPKKH